MSQVLQGICWAAILIALVLANRFGLIADKDAAVMIAIVPAVWIAATSRGRKCRMNSQA